MQLRNFKCVQYLVYVIALLSCLAPVAQQPLAPAPRKPALMLGTAWYPEQWPESRWDADPELMRGEHIHFVRVGEFAWSSLEPHEGEFQLDWLTRAVRLAGKHGIGVVIGTPSAAPPAWLTQTYPRRFAPWRPAARLCMAAGSNLTGAIRSTGSFPGSWH